MEPQDFSEILLEGLAPDGGLAVPEFYPQVALHVLESWKTLSYGELAFEVLRPYATDIPEADLKALTTKTYTRAVYGTEEITPVRELFDGMKVLELSNGPTLAFKDMAMQLLGNLFEYALARQGAELNIFGATSGDLFGSADLKILENPWANGVTADLLARMEMDVSTAGNCYIRRLPNRLSVLPPEYVHIVLASQEDTEHPEYAPDVEVLGYAYRPPHGKAVLFLPEDVAHYAPIPDPDRHFLGMSWVTPVSTVGRRYSPPPMSSISPPVTIVAFASTARSRKPSTRSCCSREITGPMSTSSPSAGSATFIASSALTVSDITSS